MMVTCPCCFARYDLVATLNDSDARNAVSISLKFPPELSDLILRYAGLFRPKGRALSWKKIIKILVELDFCIKTGKINRHGRAWTVTIEQWRQGLDEILNQADKLNLPLKSHGYLYEILAGISNKIEADNERNTEHKRQARAIKTQADYNEKISEVNHLKELRDAATGAARDNLDNQVENLEAIIREYNNGRS